MARLIRDFDSIDDAGKKRIEDAIFAASKLGVSLIPVAGPILSELMGYLFSGPAQDRMAEYFRDLDERLTDLIESGVVTMEDLKTNQDFFNVVINAIPKALHAFEEEKRRAFMNAILNTAQRLNPNETKTQIFLRQLEIMTVTHIKILHFFLDPKAWFHRNEQTAQSIYGGSSLLSSLLKAYPEFKAQDNLVDLIWNDLKAAGFHRSGDLKTIITGEGALAPQLTSFGSEFIHFITFEDKI